ncbi:MAG: DUF1501 domain-containing protein [Planctomycetota bacterium]
MSDWRMRPQRNAHIEIPTTRRECLMRSGVGFGSLALGSLLGQGASSPLLAAPAETSSKPHHRATAKRVIFLFMEGGPSHLDLFDPKPLLNELAGQPIPDSFGEVVTAMGEYHSPLLECQRKWERHGESGLWVSDWFPKIATHADDLAVIRSCVADGINHSAGVCQMNTCSILSGRPSLGAWATYGLGTENQDLPSFVVMQDNPSQVVNGPRNWGAGFMPAAHQGTRLSEGKQPIAHLNSPEGFTAARQEHKLAFLEQLNRSYAEKHPEQSELEARIASYELAFRMQAEAPEAIDLTQETQSTLDLYGIGDKSTNAYGRLCLLGRRLAERGVRFIQLYSGAGSKWDSHDNIERKHADLCQSVDQPISALLTDLKQRGMLDETLVVWGGEFGRTPMSEKGNGRDHNPSGFTMWMAGGGVKGGQVIGETDELGLHAIADRQHVHDLHASILHLMGLDHMRLTYHYKGRPERPTVNEGRFCEQLISG